MSTSLREFLKQKGPAYSAEAERNKLVIDEWRTAVDTLFDRLSAWIKNADPEGLIQSEAAQVEVTEPGLGKYRVARLNIRAFGKWVGLIPKARKTVKRAAPQQPGAPERAAGRVDITDEIRRYVLYRFPGAGGDEWFIDDPATGGEPQPLTPERFEAALLSYFQ